MLRVAFQTLRFRTGGFVASFVVLMLGATVVMACGGLMESGIRKTLPPQRLAAPPLVVTGSQNYRDTTLPERARLDSRLIAGLRALPGVARVVPDVSFPVAIVRDHRPIAIGAQPAGHGWISAQLAPFGLRNGNAPQGPREVVFNSALAARTGTLVGDRLELAVRGHVERFRLVGIASAASGASSSVFFFGPATPRLLGHVGAVDSIGIFAKRGVDLGRLQRRIEDALPAGTRALRGDERGLAEYLEAQGQAADLVALSGVFGGLAVMVAVFVVASTLGLSLQLRRRELALLRAIGTTPRQLRRMVRSEALLVALPATALAYLPSVRLGHWLLGRLAASGVVSPALRYEQSWIPTMSAVAIGVITAVAAALIAARGATRIRPVEALAEASLERRWLSPLRLLFALLCLAGGLALAIVTALVLAGPVAASTAAPAALLWAAGLALLAPGIARVLTALLSWPVRALSGLAGRLAMLNTRANRIRTAGALTPIMLATGLATALLYMQTSQTSAAVQAYTNNLRADVVLTSSLGGLPLELARVARRQPGVAAASALVISTGFFEQPGESAASVPLQGIDAEGAAQTTAFELTAGTLARLRGNTIAVAARDARPGRRLGDTVRVRLGDGTVKGLKVVAVFAAKRGYESALVPARLLAPHTTNGLADQILVRATPGADQRRLRARLARLSRRYPGLRIAGRTQATADYASNQQISAWVNYLLVAVIVGYTVVSLVNALVIATAARRREFALQRLIGSTRAQIVRMMTIEGLFLAAAGTERTHEERA
jgi:putative ABC transport system permease protein